MPSSFPVLFVGDVVGTPGMEAVAAFLPSLIKRYGAACVILNGENAMDGKSITETQVARLKDLGVHVITSGNHIWENWHIQKLLADEPFLLRPFNYPRENPGRGFCTVNLGALGKVGVINLQGRVFMSPIDCPFHAAETALQKLNEECRVILVDFHAEATAEKIALGVFLDGKVSAVIGTHTHVQTADARIFPGGTAYITDVGMTGPYDSVVGMRKEVALRRFMRQTPSKFEPATDDVHLAAVVVTVDAVSGKALSIEPIIYPEFSRHVGNHS
ncbi:MAG: TIGR00282 family metallophosphoesterase [Bacteroidota bacterium]|nr:TIGR00282 family metallophosphoesterase [Bacteroidota bacterium]